MVTKQQQLEWMANKATWGDDRTIAYMMSRDEIGLVVGLLTRLTGAELLAGHSHIITRKEWQQERDKMPKQADQPAQPAQPAQDNSWHERGELPPVGCECEWVDESGVDGPTGSLYPCVGDTVSVCAHRQTPGGNVIAIFTWAPGDDGLRVAASRMPEDFRPLRTEREKAIDALIDIICSSGLLSKDGAAAREVAETLYDAGVLK